MRHAGKLTFGFGLVLVAGAFAASAKPVGGSSGTVIAPSTATTPVSNPQGPHPKLVADSFEHSFGKVKPGEPLTYTFKVENRGNANLEIESVTPSCGCTKGDFDKLVPPGKVGKITLTIKDTAKYKGDIIKSASVKTNDPEHQQFSLVMRATFPNSPIAP